MCGFQASSRGAVYRYSVASTVSRQAASLATVILLDRRAAPAVAARESRHRRRRRSKSRVDARRRPAAGRGAGCHHPSVRELLSRPLSASPIFPILFPSPLARLWASSMLRRARGPREYAQARKRAHRLPCIRSRSLEIFVGLASFTGCLVAVDKLYLFYATVFYKGMAMINREWEPTLRYPRRWKRGVKPPTVCVQLPMFNETFVARRIIDYSCRMEYPREQFYVQVWAAGHHRAPRHIVHTASRCTPRIGSHAMHMTVLVAASLLASGAPPTLHAAHPSTPKRASLLAWGAAGYWFERKAALSLRHSYGR